jgi:hypothetical protein
MDTMMKVLLPPILKINFVEHSLELLSDRARRRTSMHVNATNRTHCSIVEAFTLRA